MNKDLAEITHHETFESLKQKEENGCEFWSVRKLAKTLKIEKINRHIYLKINNL